MTSAPVARQTIDQLAQRIARREISARELVADCLRRIEAVNPRLNAFVTVAADYAVARAEQVDQELGRGRRRGPLHGIPYAVKDVIATGGIPTTNGSRTASSATMDEDATVVARLNQAGAVLIGKLNLWEYALTGPVFGEVRNPWNPNYSASGSSGGSAAAVAAGLVPLALGTDTGGSIRVPAAHCGVVGLRPTYGRVSRTGVTPNAWSVDTVGPIAATAADVALALRVISGPDSTSPAAGLDGGPQTPRRPADGGQRWRIGVVGAGFEHAHAEIAGAVMDGLRELERLGHRLVDVDVPHANEAAVARTLHLAEAAAYHEGRLRDAASGIGRDLRARLEEAQTFPAVAYIKALRLRRVLIDETRTAFRRCDVLAMPTDRGVPTWIGAAPGPPPATAGPNTFLASMTGEPALSLPCGFTSAPANLPISLMLQGPPHEDERLLRIGAAFQQVTPWHERYPGL